MPEKKYCRYGGCASTSFNMLIRSRVHLNCKPSPRQGAQSHNTGISPNTKSLVLWPKPIPTKMFVKKHNLLGKSNKTRVE